jgi:tetratricopeptide (TPR) repeat protein
VACLLLGKTYLALENPKQAHAALKLAMKGDLSRQQYVDTIATLVKTYIQQGLFLEALNTLEGTHAWQLSQQETIELLLLRAQVLRSIGLIDKAVAILGEKVQFLPSPALKAQVVLELTACYRELGQYEQARSALSEVFALVEPGPLAEEVGSELARICLRVGQPTQAAAVCSQLLEHTSDSAARGAIQTLLAQAYRDQKQYDRAVSAMLDSQGSRPASTGPLALPSTGP